jgi:hypothetical protein
VADFDATTQALERIVERCAAAGDRAGYFPAMYLAVTHTVRDRAEAGRFEDPERMERFVAHFAARYLDADAAWAAGDPVPAAWRVAFEASSRWRPVIVQHLLLGINAHINLDLGVTAAEIGGAGPLEAIRADFDAVNDVLAELVDGSQAALNEVSPWLEWCDRVGGGGDEAIINFSLRRARAQAWAVAVRLAPLTGPERAAAIRDVDAAAARVGAAIAHPGVWASTVLLAVRVRERADPAQVIRLLAAARPPARPPSPPSSPDG